MEFCPKCGGLMLPKRRGGELYLVCQSCGYEMKAKKLEGYAAKEVIAEEKKTKVSVFTAPSGAASEEERRQLKEEYYEVFLETMVEEEAEEGE
jgi:DNA-directed RNA polymerase subunit M